MNKMKVGYGLNCQQNLESVRLHNKLDALGKELLRRQGAIFFKFMYGANLSNIEKDTLLTTINAIKLEMKADEQRNRFAV